MECKRQPLDSGALRPVSLPLAIGLLSDGEHDGALDLLWEESFESAVNANGALVLALYGNHK